MKPIRVIIADDHPAFRAGVRDRLAAEDDIDIIAEASNGREALQLAKAHGPDVLLLDLDMPGMSGMEVTAELRKDGAELGILILSAYEYEDYIIRVIEAGASGYLIKQEPLQFIIEAVRGISRGEDGWLSRRVAAHLMKRNRPGAHRADVWAIFSDREQEVLELLARGLGNSDIGERLFISESTVKKHVNAIYEKSGIHMRAAVVAWAWENGLVEPSGTV